MLNIITCVFNNVAVARRSISSILKHTDVPFRLILVNNHSFDPATQVYLKNLAKSSERLSLRVVDPGKNIGCHAGWNFGFKYIDATFPFCSKIDDDTVVSKNWASTLIEGFKQWNTQQGQHLGILGADLDCRPKGAGKLEKVGSFTFEHPTPIISFSCVLFSVQDIAKFGPMKGKGLYGHEESYYLSLCTKFGWVGRWLQDVLVEHTTTDLKNWDYLVWKLCYGFFALTGKPFREFIKSPDFQKGWLRLIRYYFSTPREKLRKDEDPIKAGKEFALRVKEHKWVVPEDIKKLMSQ